MKRLSLFLIGLVITAKLSAIAISINGKITDTGNNPVAGVIVSDGFSCVTTNSSGAYSMTTNSAATHVYYSTPAEFEIAVTNVNDKSAVFYKKLASGTTQYDFKLKKLPKVENKFNLICIGDPQVTTNAPTAPNTSNDTTRFKGETMTDIRYYVSTQAVPCYGIALGDICGNAPTLLSPMKRILGSTRMPCFATIGNHDRASGTMTTTAFSDVFGPVNFSFARGKVHFVCLDNIRFTDGSTYNGGFTAAQITWLTQNLNAVTDRANKMLVVSYHIPVRNGSSITLKDDFLTAIKNAGFKEVHLMSGHTHYQQNYKYSGVNAGIYEHVHGAACGSWWKSTINSDGTPNGYAVFSVNGASFDNWFYKPTNLPRDFQIRLHRGNASFGGSYGTYSYGQAAGTILANIWNADTDWKIEVYEDGVKTGNMSRITLSPNEDAFAVGYHVGVMNRNYDNYSSAQHHSYIYTLKNANAKAIEVKATDKFGNVYTQSEFTTNTTTAKDYSYLPINDYRPTAFRSPIAITAVMIDPRGYDALSMSSTAANGKGGCEYAQLLALEDIDFSVTPYSLVACYNASSNTGNGVAPENGWATGGRRTFKFNLTSGKVDKGEFFYVGGAAKSFGGYNSCGIVEFAGAKWIRTIPYGTQCGDGTTTCSGTGGDDFGDANSGLFHNHTTADWYDGLAVFAGTTVDRYTFPLDAVFWGAGTTIYNYTSATRSGYLIPCNDLYSPVNTSTGADQPYFGQGTNTARLAVFPEASDLSGLIMFGGKLNEYKQWTQKRVSTLKYLTPCTGTTYQRTDIEKGTGITLYDYEGQTTLAGRKFVISGIMSDAKGSDGPVAGTVSSCASGYVHPGPYEYVQFLALEDINFATTPYSVVIARQATNQAAPANGWAEGGDRTYKFNLTSGTVSKGEFFYVGGSAKALSGYNCNCGIISTASSKWIRALNYGSVAGDGFGNATGGMMRNVDSSVYGVNGIAVFSGTSVTKTTVPVDAVFFGFSTQGSFNLATNIGYLIPNNDHYKQVSPFTFHAQTHFGQGSNTHFLFDAQTFDTGDFLLLGGELNTDHQWIKPRAITVKNLAPTCPISASYTVNDIEIGPNVTKIVDNSVSIELPQKEKSDVWAVRLPSGGIGVYAQNNIKQISIYDTQGRLLYNNRLPAETYSVTIEKRFDSIVIIKVVTDAGIKALKI